MNFILKLIKEPEGQDDEKCDMDITSVDVQTLCAKSRQNRCQDLVKLKPIKETREERCHEAIKFIHTVGFS